MITKAIDELILELKTLEEKEKLRKKKKEESAGATAGSTA